MNAELEAAASRYANLEVIDWNAEVAAHPEEVYADAIHLTPPGQVAMAALVRQHYDRWLESLTPTTTSSSTTSTTTTIATPDRPLARGAATRAVVDDDAGFDRGAILVGAVAVVAVLAVGTALSVGRRARRGTRRGR
jgi:hypothetical protein